jgi:hypothetical protein
MSNSMNDWHPYVARVSDGRMNNFPRKGLERAKARKWDVEFLVKSGTMLIGDAMYRHNTHNTGVYLQRVSPEEFDMLKAFEVPCMTGAKFVETYMGCTQCLINDNGIKVYLSSREIHDNNVAYLCGV